MSTINATLSLDSITRQIIDAFGQLGESVDAAFQATVSMGEKLREMAPHLDAGREQYRRRHLRRGRARA